jgi:hypothetical protein
MSDRNDDRVFFGYPKKINDNFWKLNLSADQLRAALAEAESRTYTDKNGKEQSWISVAITTHKDNPQNDPEGKKPYAYIEEPYNPDGNPRTGTNGAEKITRDSVEELPDF